MRRYDEQKPFAKLYRSKQWRDLRKVKLSHNPYCERCLREYRIAVATVVHHKTAHKGDPFLFGDYENLESLCKLCHDGIEQSIERRGYDKSVEADGWPSDVNHPLNRQ